VAIHSAAVNHCHDLLGRLATGRQEVAEFAGVVLPALQRAVGFDGWCLGLADPVSKLPSAAVVDNAPLGDRLPQFWRFEFAHLAGRAAGVSPATARGAARRDPDGARRFDELLSPVGVGDELRIPLIADRVYWGALGLFRSQGGRPFSQADVAVGGDLMPALTAGARSTWVSIPPRSADGEAAEPGTLLLTAEGRVLSQTDRARHWLARLGGGHSMMPAVVAMLGTRTTASTRTRTVDGIWLRVSGARLEPAAGQAAIAITLQPASPAEITPLLLRAYGLTPRQRVVSRFLLAGHSTQQIATALRLSPHTVNDHVKAIVAKVGVHSRAELAAVLTGQFPASR